MQRVRINFIGSEKSIELDVEDYCAENVRRAIEHDAAYVFESRDGSKLVVDMKHVSYVSSQKVVE